MMNELIELFAGAYNNIIPEDYINHDYFMSVLIIVITACVILGCFLLISFSPFVFYYITRFSRTM